MIDFGTVLVSCISGAFVGILTDIFYWRLATGGYPWTRAADRKGKYIMVQDYDEKTGRFKGSLNFSINDVLGLTDRSIMQFQLSEKDKKIKELELNIRELQFEQKIKKKDGESDG
jgi:hypothetical protein